MGRGYDRLEGLASASLLVKLRWLGSLALVMALAAVIGCGSQQASVSGVLLAVEAEGLTGLRQLTLRDDSGQTWVLEGAADTRGDEGRPVSPAHLRQHMAGGDRVTVAYRREGGRLLAIAISDER